MSSTLKANWANYANRRKILSDKDMSKNLFMVISAPSGAGKSSICQGLMKACPEIKFSVSYTSRPPRPNEINGKDYYFISRSDFKKRIRQKEFIEWVENYGQLYGSSWKFMEEYTRNNKDVLLDIEPRGAKKIKKEFKGGVYIYILPPSRDELLKRLEKRGHETRDDIKKRFKQSDNELKEISWYDYVIINQDLKKAIKQLVAIYVAEKCKRSRLQKEINEFKK